MQLYVRLYSAMPGLLTEGFLKHQLFLTSCCPALTSNSVRVKNGVMASFELTPCCPSREIAEPSCPSKFAREGSTSPSGRPFVSWRWSPLSTASQGATARPTMVQDILPRQAVRRASDVRASPVIVLLIVERLRFLPQNTGVFLPRSADENNPPHFGGHPRQRPP